MHSHLKGRGRARREEVKYIDCVKGHSSILDIPNQSIN